MKIAEMIESYENSIRMRKKNPIGIKAIFYFIKAMLLSYLIKNAPESFLVRAHGYKKMGLKSIAEKNALKVLNLENASDNHKASAYCVLLSMEADSKHMDYYMQACSLIDARIKIPLKIELLKNIVKFEKKIGNVHFPETKQKAIDMAIKYGYKEKLKGLKKI